MTTAVAERRPVWAPGRIINETAESLAFERQYPVRALGSALDDLVHIGGEYVERLYAAATDPDRGFRLLAEARQMLDQLDRRSPADTLRALTTCRELASLAGMLRSTDGGRGPVGPLSFVLCDAVALQRRCWAFAATAARHRGVIRDGGRMTDRAVWELVEGVRLEAGEEAAARPGAAPHAAVSHPTTKVKGKDINARLLALLEANPDAYEWPARELARVLDCAPSTVMGTPAWEKVKRYRVVIKAERASRRRDERRDD